MIRELLALDQDAEITPAHLWALASAIDHAETRRQLRQVPLLRDFRDLPAVVKKPAVVDRYIRGRLQRQCPACRTPLAKIGCKNRMCKEFVG